jgi:hypothetical protein
MTRGKELQNKFFNFLKLAATTIELETKTLVSATLAPNK